MILSVLFTSPHSGTLSEAGSAGDTAAIRLASKTRLKPALNISKVFLFTILLHISADLYCPSHYRAYMMVIIHLMLERVFVF